MQQVAHSLSQEKDQQKSLLTLFTTTLKQDHIHALTLTEPWGTLIATGAKVNETRTWPARSRQSNAFYTGPLAIHLSRRMDEEVCYLDPFAQALHEAGYHPDPRRHPKGNSWALPLGNVIALAWLSQVWHINDQTKQLLPKPGTRERTFGNYQPNRYVWTFSCVYRLSSPIPAKGALGIWQWTPTDAFWNEIQTQSDQLRLQLGQ